MEDTNMNENFWDLSWGWYLLGFLFAPRVTIIILFNMYVTHGFEWRNYFVLFTIWWQYPLLHLTLWQKVVFDVLLVFFPRLLLGLLGYFYLFPDNYTDMLPVMRTD
jgi:hypothetical protein